MSGARIIETRLLTRDAFAPFGDVIDVHGDQPRAMNGDKALRYHALAETRVRGDGARVVISIAVSRPVSGLVRIPLVERHPFGSQAFVPLGDGSLLIVVCPDDHGRPGKPLAFVAAARQGVNYRANVWHGVLAPIDREQSYLMVDRDGVGSNLEEHHFDAPWFVQLGNGLD